MSAAGSPSLILEGRRFAPGELAALVSAPAHAGVEDLRIFDCALDDDAIEEMLDAMRLPALRALYLGWNHIGPRGALALARAPALAALDVLYLYNNRLGDEGVAHLSDGSVFDHLRSFNCCLNGVTASGMHALARGATLQHLTHLHAGINQLGDAGARALAASERLGALEELNLRVNGVGEAGAAAIASTPRLARLERLYLEGNPIGPTGAAQVTTLRALRVLNLDDTALGPAGARALAAAPAPELTHLHAGTNAIGDEGAIAFADAALPASLVLLDLAENAITRRGADRVTAAHACIGELRLGYNAF